MHIWDITTPAMCLCVCVPTDGFMSPTQCVGGQGRLVYSLVLYSLWVVLATFL